MLALAPSTAAPGATVTVTGNGSRNVKTRLRIAGTQVAEFTTGSSGQFGRMVTVPPHTDGPVPVTEQQYRWWAWRQVDSGTLTIKNIVTVQKPPAPMNLRATPGNHTVTLAWT